MRPPRNAPGLAQPAPRARPPTADEPAPPKLRRYVMMNTMIATANAAAVS